MWSIKKYENNILSKEVGKTYGVQDLLHTKIFRLHTTACLQHSSRLPDFLVTANKSWYVGGAVFTPHFLKLSHTINTAPIKIAESAILNAGQW